MLLVVVVPMGGASGAGVSQSVSGGGHLAPCMLLVVNLVPLLLLVVAPLLLGLLLLLLLLLQLPLLLISILLQTRLTTPSLSPVSHWRTVAHC